MISLITHFMVGSHTVIASEAKQSRLAWVYSCLMLAMLVPVSAKKVYSCADYDNYQYLDYTELKVLSNHKKLGAVVKHKYEATMDSVFCAHAEYKQEPLKFNEDLRRNYIRATHWNIERGFNIDTIAKIYNSPDKYLEEDIRMRSRRDEAKILDEIKVLKETDVFLLNEVDMGMHRTNYRNIAQEMADLIGGSYAFVPEFLEVDRHYLEDPELDRDRYHAMHGNAIVSKFPIKSMRYIRLPLCYDWFEEENKTQGALEQARRASSAIAIDEQILTEVRQGSRVALVVDLDIPGDKDLTAVTVHLENRTGPKCRVKQIEKMLKALEHMENPLVLGGDFNNFEKSAEPISVTKIVKKTVTNPANAARATLSYFNPYGLVTSASAFTLGLFRKHKNPTVADIPVILPNKAKKLFNKIEDFEFADDAKFDFSGRKRLSYLGHVGELSNSNQRAGKGFVETFKFAKSYGIAKYKIDWLFVKPLKKPEVDEDDFEDLRFWQKRYLPAQGQVLKDLNYSYKQGNLSDHSPVTCQIVL